MNLDHLVVTCADLDEGAAYVEEALGLPMEAGGRHALFGTWNRLLRLGDGEYLEVIAPDPEAAPPPRPRWFGLDTAGAPRLSHVILRGEPGAGALEMSRGAFAWRVTLATDAVPGVIAWDGAHPAERLPDRGARLLRWSAPFTVDDPRASLGPWGATILTPDGERQL